jgi:oligopeptide transport system substrate-binding protein
VERLIAARPRLLTAPRPNRWWPRCLLACGVLTAHFFFGGCRRPTQTAADAALAAGILLVGNGPEPVSLDPQLSTGVAEINIQMALFEGLVHHHPLTLEPLPGLALSWQVSDDGLRWRFALRPDARWSDGSAVTAADFVFAWRRVLSPRLAAPYASMLYCVAGAEAVHRAGADPALLGVRAPDSHVLEVDLARPTPHFLQLVLHPVWFPLPTTAVRAAGAADDRANPWAVAPGMVSNGPFRLSAWQPRARLSVRANPHYHAAAQIKLAGIDFLPLDEPSAEERAFQAGQLHATDALPPARVAAWRDRVDSPLRIDPYLGTYYLLPNHRVPPLDDPRVRAALSLAIDRQAIAGRILGAGQQAAATFVPPTIPGYTAPPAVIHDPATARALLAAAGFAGGRGFPVLEYLFNTSDSHRRIAEALQAMWRQELGIEVRLVNAEWRSYLARRAAGDYQLARAVWIGDYADPLTFLDLWTTGSTQNWIGWSDPAYDARIAQAAMIADPADRARLFAEAEASLINAQAIIPLYFYVTAYLLDRRVRGWHHNVLDWPNYRFVSLGD